MKTNPILAGCTLLLAGATASYGQGGGRVQFRDWNAAAATVKPKAACASLRALTSYDLSVIGATVIPAASGVPEHCRVSVMVQPEINIEVNLPADWNGRFYMFGNGGLAGEPFDTPARVQNRAQGLKAGFAPAATDTGHTAAEPIGTFAQNRQKLLDFAFRSLHVTAETGKLLVRAYYGDSPAKSYFDGCSQGGRQALILAQRFPADFDGILAGAPALDYVGSQVARAYWLQGLAASPIAPSKLKLVADSVYAKCDAKDGLKDGLIDDPRRCDFHPAQDLPRCAEGINSANCFRPGEIASIERIYGDVMNQGRRFFPGWPAGAEVAGANGQSGWIGEALNAPDGQPGAWQRYTDPFLRFMAFPEKDPASSLAGFDIDRDPQRLSALRQILDATDPDLSAFRQRNGKLLMYFGWADPQLNPLMGVEYYEKVTERMGPSTSDFARLFMVPGMFHCGGGVGTDIFDAATPLLNWVETGKVPDRIAASRVVDSQVVRTRPLCPYPQVARYKGAGSIDDAASFSCVKP
jgi:feruloyl esterase